MKKNERRNKGEKQKRIRKKRQKGEEGKMRTGKERQKNGELEETAVRRRQRRQKLAWVPLSLYHPSPPCQSLPPSQANSMRRAQRCLVPGRAGICPQQPDSGPTPAPGHLLPPPGWKRGIAPHKPRVSSRLPTLPAWARGALNHTWRYSGFSRPLPGVPWRLRSQATVSVCADSTDRIKTA